MSFRRKLSFKKKYVGETEDVLSPCPGIKINEIKNTPASTNGVNVKMISIPECGEIPAQRLSPTEKVSQVVKNSDLDCNIENFGSKSDHPKTNGHLAVKSENDSVVEDLKANGDYNVKCINNGINKKPETHDRVDVNLCNGFKNHNNSNGFEVNKILNSDCHTDTAVGKSNDSRNLPQRNGLETKSSFAIPDGLTMDPMAPTALAVSTEFMERLGSGLSLLRDHGKKLQKYVSKHKKFEVIKRSWKSIVNVVLVDAKDLPNGPAGTLYCKFKLGTETHKSKQVSNTKAAWCERFNLYLYEDNILEVTVWHKGKQKNFMGRCTIDLSQLEKEKTHDLWSELECGYVKLHLLVTLSATARSIPLDGIPTTNGVHNNGLLDEDYSWYRLDNSWSEVGQLTVTVHGARGLTALGLSGRADAYCVLELDNSRVQTHTVRGTCDPTWNNTYTFCVNDITSTLDISVYDESIITSMKGETLGKISIPLLRINNDEKRWYALKDRSKKSGARGNCPRILLEMSVVWNPIKASMRVLRPKETKYVKKPPKFDIPLIYSNLKFIRDIFSALYVSNEQFKLLFEWESQEKNAIALAMWLTFWHFFRIWMAPLLLLLPFIYNWTQYRSCNNNALVPYNGMTEEEIQELEDAEIHKDDKSIKNRIYGLQDLTFTIKNGIDYICSVMERLKNLTNFSVPFLSYFAMVVLVVVSAVLYFVPFSYLMMLLGIYKFSRKLLNPTREPNNDTLDFISRIPDNEMLKQWRELKVPEPNLNRTGSFRRR